MTDDGKLMQQVERADKAKSVLENPLFMEAMEAISARIVEGFTQSPPDATDLRERSYIALKLHQNIREHLETYIKTGDFASRELLEIRKKRGIFRNG